MAAIEADDDRTMNEKEDKDSCLQDRNEFMKEEIPETSEKLIPPDDDRTNNEKEDEDGCFQDRNEFMKEEIPETSEKLIPLLYSDNEVGTDPVFTEPNSVENQVASLKKESGNKYPGLVIAVVGEKTSYVPTPWNITRFTSELVSVISGVNNYWIIYNTNQSLTYYLENAFEIERSKEDDEQDDDSYFVIMPDEDHPKQNKSLKIGDCNLPDILSYLAKKFTALIGSKSNMKSDGLGLEMKVPVVMLVAEGDILAAELIKETIDNKTSVLLIKGSGKIADLISNDLLNSEVNLTLLKKKAALLLGLFFQEKDMDDLIQLLKAIKKSEHLINVYDLNNPEVRMEDFVTKSIITAWALEGKKEQQEQETGSKTVTMNILTNIPQNHQRLMKIYQTELKPGSSPLYFYIAYQYIQENQSKEHKEKDLSLLLVEAILANRVEYVSAMLQNKVKFKPGHLDILYQESLKCSSCKGKDCLKIHSIHHRESSLLTEKIWCTCSEECELKAVECKNGCKKYIVTCLINLNHQEKRQNKEDILEKIEDRNGSDLVQAFQKKLAKSVGGAVNLYCSNECECMLHKSGKILSCTTIGVPAKELCNELLNFVPDFGSHSDNKIHPKEKEEEGVKIYHDLLLWSLFSNKPDLAGVFWTRCDNQLLTALMASALLNNMAETAKSLQNRKLQEELSQQSKVFHDRVIEMQNSLYEENEDNTMTLMHAESTVWGIKISPMKFAFENKMIDVIGHQCVQRKMNRIWYNKPRKSEPGQETKVTDASANLWDYCVDFCCCCCCCWWPTVTGKSILNAFQSPLTVFIVHYVLMFALLVAFSAFLLTDLKTIQSVRDVSWYERILYVYLFADWVEESLYPNLIRNRYRRRQKHPWCCFKIKRFFTDLWSVFRWLSYLVMLNAVSIRLANSEDLHRATLRLYSLGLFLIYIRFLQCMIVNSYLGTKLIMIAEMLWELLKFVWILILFMLCTGVLYHANMYPNHYDMFPNFEYMRLWKIISLPYWQIYGELFLEDLKGENNANGSCTFVREEWEANPGELERCVDYDWALLVIAALYFLFTNLLLVNLLIAIFSNEYEQININSDRLWKFSRYSIITKFEDRSPVPLNLLWMFVRIYKRCQKYKNPDTTKCEKCEMIKCGNCGMTRCKNCEMTKCENENCGMARCKNCGKTENRNLKDKSRCFTCDVRRQWFYFLKKTQKLHAEKCLYQENTRRFEI